MKRHTAMVLCLALPAAGALAQPTRPEQRQVTELYGASINRVANTREIEDDLALARELLALSRDAALDEPLRFALAYQAMELAGAVGSTEGAQLADEALDQAGQIRRLGRAEQLRAAREIAMTRLTRSAERGVPPAERPAIAAEAIERTLAWCDAVGRRMDPADLRDPLVQAQSYARMFELAELNEQLTERITDLNESIAFRRRLEAARAELAAAERAEDISAERQARANLALLHLQYDGDVVSAGQVLGETDHPHADALAKASAFLTDPNSVPAAELLDVAETLANVADPLRETSGQIVARHGLTILDAFVASDPSPSQLERAAELRRRLDELAGQGPRDLLLAGIAATYGQLHGQLTILDADARRIRITWNMGTPTQMNDFIPDGAGWSISRGRLVAAPQGAAATTCATKLVFDGSRPLSFRYSAAGARALNAQLQTSGQFPFAPAQPYQFILGGANPRSPTGAGITGPTGQPRMDPAVGIQPGTTYRCQVEWTGQGDLTWTVNGRSSRWDSAENASLPQYLRPALQTAGGPTAYNDVTIEGVLIIGSTAQGH